MAVSSSTVKGFTPTRSLSGKDIPNSLPFLIENSATLTIGDAVRLDTNGCIKRCAAGDPAVLGIVQDFKDSTGQVSPFSPRIPSAAITGATLTPDDTLATASDNRTNTTKQLKADVILDVEGAILFRNVASAALIQANIGQFFNLTSTNSGQIDQATASNTNGQFQLVSLDPDGDGNTSKGLFRIVQQQLASNNSSYGSTAIITA